MSGKRQRPAGVPDDIVEAVGRASEAFEYVIRARGHLYSLHQLIGRADFLLAQSADLLESAGCADDASTMRADLVGRNVLDGRWTFQVVEEFDTMYYRVVEAMLERLTDQHLAGTPHIYESEMKEQRRTAGRLGHEARPRAAYADFVETEPD
jgi:hypothetical protein